MCPHSTTRRTPRCGCGCPRYGLAYCSTRSTLFCVYLSFNPHKYHFLHVHAHAHAAMCMYCLSLMHKPAQLSCISSTSSSTFEACSSRRLSLSLRALSLSLSPSLPPSESVSFCLTLSLSLGLSSSPIRCLRSASTLESRACVSTVSRAAGPLSVSHLRKPRRKKARARVLLIAVAPRKKPRSTSSERAASSLAERGTPPGARRVASAARSW